MTNSAELGKLALWGAAMNFRFRKGITTLWGHRKGILLHTLTIGLALLVGFFLGWKSSRASYQVDHDLAAVIVTHEGNKCRDSGDLDMALAKYNRAIGFEPRWADPYVRAAEIYEMRGQYELAFTNALDAFQFYQYRYYSPYPYNLRREEREAVKLKKWVSELGKKVEGGLHE